MKKFTVNHRADGRVELICSCNVGHTLYSKSGNYVHGCCGQGCCSSTLFRTLFNNFKYIALFVLPTKDFWIALEKYIQKLQDTIGTDDNVEIWKDIPGYEGLYRASTFGQVKSLARQDTMGRPLEEKILQLSYDKDGYQSVGLRKHGKNKTHKVHRLILETFIGPCPKNMQCCHCQDRNPAHNRLDNLRWDTISGNVRDAIKDGTARCAKQNGSNNHMSKLTEKQVLQIRRLYEIRLLNGQRKYTQRQLADRFNVAREHISGIISRKFWKHI